MDYLEQVDMTEYIPAAVAWGSNILLVIAILIAGFWISGRVRKAIVGIGQSNGNLDDTLFKFLGSMARYLILAFVFIAVLNRFGVQTASIIALLGTARAVIDKILAEHDHVLDDPAPFVEVKH